MTSWSPSNWHNASTRMARTASDSGSSAWARRVQYPPQPSAKACPWAGATHAVAWPAGSCDRFESVGCLQRQSRPVGAMVFGLLQRSFVKLRSQFLQIIVVYRHWRACLLRLFEAAERHISIGEPWARLEFATLGRGNYCVHSHLRSSQWGARTGYSRGGWDTSGAQKRTRTSTPSRAPGPEPGASTNSAIWAAARRGF